jgi:hypothetical protein
MKYISSTNKEKSFNWNPFEAFRQNFAGDIPDNFPLVSRGIHIQFSLSCRLRTAVNIFCFRLDGLHKILRLKPRSHKRTHIIFKPRVIESNQYDNLSPPRLSNINFRVNTLK